MAIIVLVFLANVIQPAIIDYDCTKHGNDFPPNTCSNSETIYLSESDTLNFLGVNNPTEIKHLKLLTANNRSTIPTDIFDKFPNVLHVTLQIGLPVLTAVTLERTERLKSLHLPSNYIIAIHSETFSKSSNLESINLQDNFLTRIDENTFNGLHKLQILNLQGNHLTKLQESIFRGAISLRSVDVSNNKIETVEEGVFNLVKLDEIIMNNNSIKQLSNNMFSDTPNLQRIEMKDNQLQFLSSSIFTLKKLRMLIVSNNQNIGNINVLEFAQLPFMDYLGLENTGLTHITPFSISELTSIKSPLTTLSLSHNRLSSSDILNKLSIFKKLEKLFLDHNDFTTFDDADVINIKKMFPNIDAVVTVANHWEETWLQGVLVPHFRNNRIFCNNVKYLQNYIFNLKNLSVMTIDGDECA